jgi:hypothetical protein
MYLLRLLRSVRVSSGVVARATVLSVLVLGPSAALSVSSPAFSSAVAQEIQQAAEAGPRAVADEPGSAPFPAWLPAGGLYGHQKWVPGSNGVDVFLPRNTMILAPVTGLVIEPADVVHPLPPPIPSIALRGDSGLSFFLGHVRPLVAPGAEVQAGAPLAVIDDPMLDRMSAPGPGPSGWQHVDLNVSRDGMFTWYGGNVPASPWLQSTGYEGTLIERTPGPPGLR